MPFGIDTPSLFGIAFGVLGPVMLATGDPVLAWKVGMGVTVAMGLVKLGLAFAGEWVRRLVPRAALLGSIAGVAVLLIAFLPAQGPRRPAGRAGLARHRVRGPDRPDAPARGRAGRAGGGRGGDRGVLLGRAGGSVRAGDLGAALGRPSPAVPWPTLAWLDALEAALPYLPVGLPFALATVVGGIDNTESAIAAGDRYRTRDVLLTEAMATVAAGLCGGVIQNTPYIGHPAYKAMGARAGYTLLTALAIGVGAAVGVVSLLVRLLPEAAVAPILVFIGLEIAAQAFLASPAAARPGGGRRLPPGRGRPRSDRGRRPARRPSALRECGSRAGGARGGLEPLLVLGNGFVRHRAALGLGGGVIVDRRLRLARPRSPGPGCSRSSASSTRPGPTARCSGRGRRPGPSRSCSPAPMVSPPPFSSPRVVGSPRRDRAPGARAQEGGIRPGPASPAIR